MTTSQPELINKPVAVAESIINTLIMDVSVKIAIADAIIAQPWLGWPGVKQAFTLLVNWFANKYLSKPLQTTAAFALIDAATNAEAKAYRESYMKLEAAEQTGDPDELSKATQAAREALAAVIHTNGRN